MTIILGFAIRAGRHGCFISYCHESLDDRLAHAGGDRAVRLPGLDDQLRTAGHAGLFSHPDVASQRLGPRRIRRSEEHTSELQSQSNLVCRLLLEKQKNITSLPQSNAAPLHERLQGTTKHNRIPKQGELRAEAKILDTCRMLVSNP